MTAHPGQTSAQLREAARKASFRGYYTEAAELFDLAAERYPADLHNATGAGEVVQLVREARACRVMAVFMAAEVSE